MVEPDCRSRDSGGRSGIGRMTPAAVAAALGCSCGVTLTPLSPDCGEKRKREGNTEIEVKVEIEIGIELKVGIEIETELEIGIEIDINI